MSVILTKTVIIVLMRVLSITFIKYLGVISRCNFPTSKSLSEVVVTVGLVQLPGIIKCLYNTCCMEVLIGKGWLSSSSHDEVYALCI